jgi:hypothetical protein
MVGWVNARRLKGKNSDLFVGVKCARRCSALKEIWLVSSRVYMDVFNTLIHMLSSDFILTVYVKKN